MRIFRRGLTATEWATLAGLLFRAEYFGVSDKTCGFEWEEANHDD